LSALYDPVVQLKSGGYLVINPTEALVSIDINSGRSTKEHGIEATAVNTNLEAAREIARQLRLRDMAGLVVIDFIDMEYSSNIRKVEKAMKDSLKDDRARIQVGRISSFGLMEMSRQRLRTGVLEATTHSCPHCDGTGLVRTAGSAGLSALRNIEDEAAKGKGTTITLFASQEASIYVLNAKRADLAEIEARYGVAVEVIPEGENEGAKMRVESSGPRNDFVPRFEAIAFAEEEDDFVEEDYADEEEAEEAPRGRARAPREEGAEREEGDAARRKRRKRRRGGRNRDDREDQPAGEAREDDAPRGDDDGDDEGEPRAAGEEPLGEDGQPRKRRRRSRRRRGGRNRGADGQLLVEGDVGYEAEEAEGDSAEVEAEEAPAEADAAPAKPKRSRRKKVMETEAPVEAEAEVAAEAEVEAPAKPKRVRRKKADVEAEVEAPAAEAEAPAKPKRSRAKKVAPAAVEAEPVAMTAAPAAPVAEPAPQPANASDASANEGLDENGEPRKGWWQRTFGN